MNAKVQAAFASFGVLLAVWISLVELNKPELYDLVTFIKGATFTAWTAAALFFETNSVQADKPDTAQVLPSKETQ